MKTKLIISIVTIIITISAIASINSYAEGRVNKIKASAPYVLKQRDNHVAVDKLDEMVREFKDVNYSALPEYDRNMLKKGIEFQTLEEIYSTIEDFDG